MHRWIWASCLIVAMNATAQQTAQTQTAKTPLSTTDAVTVNADRGLVGVTDSATSVLSLDQQKLQNEPGLTLDDRLHQVAGFQLFRRTSSWTANPTTQGVSLRGLGSTSASRTLVISDQVPLNDPFGGWIHWNEIPNLAIQDVTLVRGGSADLYGSSAIGGVIDLVPVSPAPKPRFHLSADASGATENSALEDLLLSGVMHRLAALGAFTGLTTGGYIPTAPQFRGKVDTEANVTSESGRIELSTPAPVHDVTAFLLGNVLNEARGNGTPLQTNATRLWRYSGGADANGPQGHALLRLYGSREAYQQTFTAIAPNRNSEFLTKLQHVPIDELGAVTQVSRAFPAAVTAALGFDVHDVRATDNESGVKNSAITSTTSTSARQRDTGGYVDAIWQPKAWSVSGSIRVDSFRTFDAMKVISNAPPATPLPQQPPQQLPQIDELFASPRIGIVRRLPHGFLLTGTAFRAFRGPTLDELYRSFQIGQEITEANDKLLAERATGFEFGGEEQGRLGRIRSTYFWTEVNRPISAVTISQTPTTLLLQRQNLGQIRSRGVMVEGQTSAWRGLDLNFGYQLAIATVTAFNASSAVQANLKGNWIPEVPREAATAAVNYTLPRIASFHLIGSYTGKEYDDAANEFLLHPYARFDISAERPLWRGLSVFAGSQNVLNRTIDAGLTPVLMLAAPRLVQGGLRYNLTR